MNFETSYTMPSIAIQQSLSLLCILSSSQLICLSAPSLSEYFLFGMQDFCLHAHHAPRALFDAPPKRKRRASRSCAALRQPQRSVTCDRGSQDSQAEFTILYEHIFSTVLVPAQGLGQPGCLVSDVRVKVTLGSQEEEEEEEEVYRGCCGGSTSSRDGRTC